MCSQNKTKIQEKILYDCKDFKEIKVIRELRDKIQCQMQCGGLSYYLVIMDGDTVLYFMPFRGNGDSGKKQVEPNIW